MYLFWVKSFVCVCENATNRLLENSDKTFLIVCAYFSDFNWNGKLRRTFLYLNSLTFNGYLSMFSKFSVYLNTYFLSRKLLDLSYLLTKNIDFRCQKKENKGEIKALLARVLDFCNKSKSTWNIFEIFQVFFILCAAIQSFTLEADDKQGEVESDTIKLNLYPELKAKKLSSKEKTALILFIILKLCRSHCST